MFDLDEFHAVEAAVRAHDTPADGMAALLDYCARRLPDPVWADLRVLEWEQDAAGLEGWLRDVLRREPPPAACAALYFGLADWEDPDGADNDLICRLSLGGADRFDPADGDCEWAAELTYSPTDAYADSHVLKAIYRLVRRRPDPVLMLGEYVLCLGYTSLVVKRAGGRMPDLLLHARDTRGIAVGFVEGDALLLGVLGPMGWR